MPNADADATGARIVALKRHRADRAAAFAALDADLRREIAEWRAMQADGVTPVPEVDFAALATGRAPGDLPDLVRRRGCVVVRGVFPPAIATAWDAEIAAYLAENDADARSRARRPERWGEGVPQMYSIYWSRPQVLARQAPDLAVVRTWLNRLWRHGDAFDPAQECTYADRIRRRLPGDTTLKLGPHIDGGTVGRWLGDSSRPYAAVLAGNPAGFDPFDAGHRTEANDPTDANACSVFRTWQGWTALSAQGPGDGTLQVLPSSRAIAWVLLRPFAPDVQEASLCGAEVSRALTLSPAWHAPLLAGLTPIPRVAPGDTVWWHPDVIHAVEPRHNGSAASNVMYIPAAPECPGNRAFLARQLPAFQDGRSPPDFPADDLETAFAGRASADLLTPLGRRQMGLA